MGKISGRGEGFLAFLKRDSGLLQFDVRDSMIEMEGKFLAWGSCRVIHLVRRRLYLGLFTAQRFQGSSISGDRVGVGTGEAT